MSDDDRFVSGVRMEMVRDDFNVKINVLSIDSERGKVTISVDPSHDTEHELGVGVQKTIYVMDRHKDKGIQVKVEKIKGVKITVAIDDVDHELELGKRERIFV